MAAMIRFPFSCFVAVLLLVGMAYTAFAQMPPPADDVFRLQAARDGSGAVTLDWMIAPGTYLYRDSLKVSEGAKLVPLALPEGVQKDDPNFGRVDVYHNHVRAALPQGLDADRLTVRYQGCAEQGICYPPVEKTLDLASLSISGSGNRLSADASRSGPWQTASPARPAVSDTNAADTGPDETGRAASYLNGNVFLMAAGFLGFGLLLSLTPCVFPMIPILSATLAGAGTKLSAARGFILSFSYVLAMAAAYGLVGLVAGLSGANLQAALQTPWALGLSAAVFIVLALGMFGLFELQLPSALTSRLAGRGRGGSVAGAAVLGFGSALIVGPCVTPPLAAAMLYAINTGEAAKGAVALFALGLGMGLPLVAFGTFGARILPKSGPWLVAIRQVFGVVFLGVAVMLVARLLPPPAALALWGATAIGLAVFVGAFDRISAGSGWGQRAAKAGGLVMFIAGAVMLVGAAAGEGDPLKPLAFLAGAPQPSHQVAETRVTASTAFDEALARSGQTPVLVSFTADWCTICKSNEKIMAEPAIAARLQDVSMITVDVTRQNGDARALMDRFSVVGPPTLFLVDRDGREIGNSRITGAITPETISQNLSRAGA
ncbi:protein-disulfide reductase DsbD [Martelella radicis]|uniref:Thiol:disulfide interchange protein DsbD n=1 Tax=Martelella radicis TaxID=1397476 RepID=A0A7W6KQW4_9HYPH|nr:protein-disulfide reductase DsbD [Martelella radicis]MBB4124459.1 thiol:disulfide interchange protein DsbD [Martelella radicis]